MVAAVILSGLILPGCGTTLPLINNDLSRQKPVEAFSDCGPLSELPANLPEIGVSDAVSLILTAHLDDIAAYHDCKRKHEALREWVKSE